MGQVRSVIRRRPGLLVKRVLEKLFIRPKVDSFYGVLGGHIIFQTLSAGVQLNLFGLLAEKGPLGLDDIAKGLGVETQPARILLMGCVSAGIIHQSGDRYRNSPMANRALVPGRPGDLTAILKWQHFINYRAMYHFADAIRANKNVGLDVFDGDEPTLYERLAHHPDLEKIFQDAMEQISRMSNDLLPQCIDFSVFGKTVDVGGGNGTNLAAIARKFPGLKGFVFDSPSVCEIARAHFAELGLSDRLDAVPGNCFDDPFPENTDCIMFCHFMTIWSAEKNRILLKKAYDSLNQGGAAVVFNMMQSDDGSGPVTAAVGSPYFLTLATGEGMLYTWAEYEEWMRDAGFSRIEKLPLVRDHGVIVGIK